MWYDSDTEYNLEILEINLGVESVFHVAQLPTIDYSVIETANVRVFRSLQKVKNLEV